MTKEMSTVEGNKLICEFMGLVRYNEKGHPNEYGYYDTAWNYLMPVVEKIKKIPCKDGTELLRKIDQVIHSLCLIRIDVTHKLCADFLKWYNSLPHPTNTHQLSKTQK